MLVVHVGRVGMIVRHRFVSVRMAVLAFERRIVRVGVMAVVVPVQMLVLDRLVGVGVPVRFSRVQVDGEAEEKGRHEQKGATRLLADRNREGRAGERRDREDRRRSSRADRALCADVEP